MLKSYCIILFVMPLTVVLGEQRGDEGKGRFVDMLSEDQEVVARFNGGSNAGHTVVTPTGEEFDFHLLPSGMVRPNVVNVIGNGTVINPIKLVEEIETSRAKGLRISGDNLLISSAAHLVLPHHILFDELRESTEKAQGSTKSGIAQSYADKYNRSGIRIESINNDIGVLEDLVVEGLARVNEARAKIGLWEGNFDYLTYQFMENARKLGVFVTDTVLYVNKMLENGANVLAEGAQAFQLDIDHGQYPFVTSSSTTSAGALSGLGVPYKYIDRVIGVAKAVPSHVGGGPFVTEIRNQAVLEGIHGDMTTVDAEVGTTTGRVRRLGHLDLALIKRSQMINGSTEMAITKLDWVRRYGKTALICVAYERKGKRLSVSPDAAYKMEQSSPIYKELSVWDEDISNVRNFDDLPNEAIKYIQFIEEQTNVPITMIGVGPKRDQVIIR